MNYTFQRAEIARLREQNRFLRSELDHLQTKYDRLAGEVWAAKQHDQHCPCKPRRYPPKRRTR